MEIKTYLIVTLCFIVPLSFGQGSLDDSVLVRSDSSGNAIIKPESASGNTIIKDGSELTEITVRSDGMLLENGRDITLEGSTGVPSAIRFFTTNGTVDDRTFDIQMILGNRLAFIPREDGGLGFTSVTIDAQGVLRADAIQQDGSAVVDASNSIFTDILALMSKTSSNTPLVMNSSGGSSGAGYIELDHVGADADQRKWRIFPTSFQKLRIASYTDAGVLVNKWDLGHTNGLTELPGELRIDGNTALDVTNVTTDLGGVAGLVPDAPTVSAGLALKQDAAEYDAIMYYSPVPTLTAAIIATWCGRDIYFHDVGTLSITFPEMSLTPTSTQIRERCSFTLHNFNQTDSMTFVLPSGAGYKFVDTATVNASTGSQFFAAGRSARFSAFDLTAETTENARAYVYKTFIN